MEKVNLVYLAQFRNSEYFELVTDLKTMISGVLPSSPSVDKVLAKFETSYQDMDTVMRLGRGSALTPMLKVKDKDRGNIWKGMNLIIDAHLLSSVKEKVESALKLRRVFDVYGDFRNHSYNEESNDGRNLVQDLEKPKNATHCVTINLDDWVPLYKSQLESFKALQNERNNELAFKENGDVRAIRMQMDPVYHEIINKVNAFVELGMETPEIENFVRLFNSKLKVYEDTLAIRQGKRNTETVPEISENIDE